MAPRFEVNLVQKQRPQSLTFFLFFRFLLFPFTKSVEGGGAIVLQIWREQLPPPPLITPLFSKQAEHYDIMLSRLLTKHQYLA